MSEALNRQTTEEPVAPATDEGEVLDEVVPVGSLDFVSSKGMFSSRCSWFHQSRWMRRMGVVDAALEVDVVEAVDPLSRVASDAAKSFSLKVTCSGMRMPAWHVLVAACMANMQRAASSSDSRWRGMGSSLQFFGRSTKSRSRRDGEAKS